MSFRRCEIPSSTTPPPSEASQTPFRGSSLGRTSRMARSLTLLGCLGLATQMTCGQGRPDGEQNLDENNPDQVRLVSLTLKPNNDILLVDLNAEATKAFTVRGLYSDGSSADFTRKVRFSLDNNAVGKFSGPTFKALFSRRTRSIFRRSTPKSPTTVVNWRRWQTSRWSGCGRAVTRRTSFSTCRT